MTRAVRLTPGGSVEPIFSAARQNAIADLLDAENLVNPPLPFLEGTPPITTDVLVRNVTAGLVPRGGVLGLKGTLLNGSLVPGTFKGSPPQFEGDTPLVLEHSDRIAVCLEDHAAGKLRKCRITGYVPARVLVTDTGHKYAQITNGDPSTFTSKLSGGYAFFPAEAGTGQVWGLVHLGEIHRRIIKGMATTSVPTDQSYFDISGLQECAGGLPLTGTLNVRNILSQAYNISQTVYVVWNDVVGEWQAFSPGQQIAVTPADEFTLVRANANETVAYNTASFQATGVELLAGTQNPGDPITVHNVIQDTYRNGEYFYAVHSVTNNRWENFAAKVRYTLVSCAANVTVPPGQATFTADSIERLAGTLDPGPSITVHNLVGQAYDNGERLVAVYNHAQLRWENFAPTKALTIIKGQTLATVDRGTVTFDLTSIELCAGSKNVVAPVTVHNVIKEKYPAAFGPVFAVYNDTQKRWENFAPVPNRAGDGINISQDHELTVRQGQGLRFVNGVLEVHYGCGLHFVGGILEVNRDDLMGTGLSPGTGCSMNVDAQSYTGGCGINVAGMEISVDVADLAGAGLGFSTAGGTCVLNVGQGCGLTVGANTVSIDNAQLALEGLVTSGSCGVAVGQGCGLIVSADAVAVDVAALAGGGLKSFTDPGPPEVCRLDIGQGCGISVTADAVAVDSSQMDGPGLQTSGSCGLQVGQGCGISVGSSTVSVDNAQLALEGLVTSGSCGVAVGQGCGISVTADAVAVDVAQLAGQGLAPYTVGGLCRIDIGQGCGLSVTADEVAVDVAQLAGQGLAPYTVAGLCRIDIGQGCGLTVGADTVSIDNAQLALEGLVTSGSCGVAVGQGCGISVTDDAVAVDSSQMDGPGLQTSGTCGLQVGQGCGITVGSSTVSVDPSALAGNGLMPNTGTGSDCKLDINIGCGLKIENGVLQVKREDLIGSGLAPGSGTSCELEASGTELTAGCGIDITTGTISVKPADLAGQGLIVDSGSGPCAMRVNLGCGLSPNGDQIVVNNFALAGAGLSAVFTPTVCSLAVNVGCGIQIVDDNLTVNPVDLAGAGLVPNTAGGSACKLDIVGGCGINVTADQIEVDLADFVGRGLEQVDGTCPRIDVDLGCGLEFDGTDQIQVKRADLAGNGLTNGAGTCDLAVNPGCGIDLIADRVTFDPADAAGDGLAANKTAGACKLDLDFTQLPAGKKITVRSITGCTLDDTGNTLTLKLQYQDYEVFGVASGAPGEMECNLPGTVCP